MFALAACSGQLRTKPQLDCNGADPYAVVCSDGILGSCAGGSPQYSVCSDTTVCQASWQQAGAYKCAQDEALADAGLLMYAHGSSDAYLLGVALRVTGETNADGFLSSGEAGTISIELRNASPEILRNVTGTLSTSHGDVTITSGSELYFGDLAVRGSACGSSTPERAGDCSNFSSLTKLQIAESFALDRISFELTVRDAAAQSTRLSFELALDTPDRY